MLNSITLTASMRTNLASLKTIATQMNKTQNILSTGKKVNSAIDNASAYYQARALTNRASDLSALLDSIGQGIQTIQAATEGLTSASAFLEQATAVANQALTDAKDYTVIDSSMTKSEIEALLVDDAKVILKDNITLSEGLEITAKNVTIYGNGKTLTVNADDTAAITVKGKGVNAEIKGLKINANGTNTYGIKATESGTITIDNLDNVTATGTGAAKYYYRDEDFFKGQEYTQAIYDQLSAAGSVSGTATDKAMSYYAIDAGDEDFGAGKWYIGAIGEWTDLYGYDYADITGGGGKDGANGTTFDKVNATLGVIDGATTLSGVPYWSSSEYNGGNSWSIINGRRGYAPKYHPVGNVRCFQLLENCYNPAAKDGPQIGDIMYADKTWSSASDYDKMVAADKTAVGVIFDVDTINGDVKIVALNDAHTSVKISPSITDITNVPNYDSTADLKNTGEIIVTYENAKTSNTANLSEQYGSIMNEFDKLINDTSYQGVNLLKGADLTLTFNESRSNKFTVSGRDMGAENLGLTTRDWASKTDVESAIKELTEAIDEIREFQTELGNNYSIIQTRQNFTEALCDVLETGADNLVLADMNEASAEYLMLQTRQQLATNSLSLAAQSAQSILSLF